MLPLRQNGNTNGNGFFDWNTLTMSMLRKLVAVVAVVAAKMGTLYVRKNLDFGSMKPDSIAILGV